MIGDVKTALDRYLTHSLTRALDRQSWNFFQWLRGTTRRHGTCKKRDAARTRDGKTHRPHITSTNTAHTCKNRRHTTQTFEKIEEIIVWGGYGCGDGGDGGDGGGSDSGGCEGGGARRGRGRIFRGIAHPSASIAYASRKRSDIVGSEQGD